MALDKLKAAKQNVQEEPKKMEMENQGQFQIKPVKKLTFSMS